MQPLTKENIPVAANRNRIVDTVRNYGRQLAGFIRGRVRTEEEAEDILQDVWYQLTNVNDLDAIESVSAWLYEVARNKITDNFRKKKPGLLDDKKNETENNGYLKEWLDKDGKNAEDEMMKDMFWEALMEALDELPENQREVFVMNELEEYTLQEIADIKKQPLKTIISRKGYAVKHLRKKLENMYNEFLKS